MQTEALKELYGQGLTYAKIAAALNTTRNAVAGKVWRLGLSTRVKPVRSEKPKTIRTRAMATATHRKSVKFGGDELTALEPSVGLYLCQNILELRDGDCRWPIQGDGLETMFCAAPLLPGCSYCAHHFRRSIP